MILRAGTVAIVRAQRRPRQFRCSFKIGHYRCDEALRVFLSKLKQAQLSCSSLTFAIAHLCPKGDDSVRCAPADERAVVRILFPQIATDDFIGTTVAESPRALLAGSGPARFEDDNQEITSNRQTFSH
jgi:hypothetical protein